MHIYAVKGEGCFAAFMLRSSVSYHQSMLYPHLVSHVGYSNARGAAFSGVVYVSTDFPICFKY
jgi:hypothetical protein